MSRFLLLIDDDDMVALSFSEYLVREGFAVDSARDLPAAHRYLATRTYSAIWLDLHLTGVPTVECLGFLRNARALAPASMIIAASGYASPDLEQSALAAGADRFLQKPFDARGLAEALRFNGMKTHA